jgi:xanthine dehydrogenase YagS FAD-binding subunit
MVLAVEIPAPVQGSRGTFLKLKEREAFDFAIVSAAIMVAAKGDTVSDARIVLGGVAPFPLRVNSAEATLKGNKVRDVVEKACNAAVLGAQPMSNNSYKVKATQGIIEKVLRSIA